MAKIPQSLLYQAGDPSVIYQHSILVESLTKMNKLLIENYASLYFSLNAIKILDKTVNVCLYVIVPLNNGACFVCKFRNQIPLGGICRLGKQAKLQPGAEPHLHSTPI